MYLMAPAEQIQTTIVLPNAQPDDTKNNVISLSHRRSINNTIYTYVKTTGRVRLVYKFNLFRGKAFELAAFIEAYLLSNIRVVDYNGVLYVATLSNDPFEFVAIGRNEYTEITLTFEGVQL